ncbi:MAG: EFR1 family ferrodoxin [Eubacteriaceae bacterium]|jgi:ferredoxin/flavodoxin
MIFYFSSTGNSEAAAKQIAEATGDQTMSITGILRSPQVPVYNIQNEPLGFVLPVYYDGMPSVIDDFISRVGFNPEIGAYIYLVLTTGDTTGDAQRRFNELLARDGLTLNACFAVKAPGLKQIKGKSRQEIWDMMDRMTEEVSRIIPKIVSRKQGDFDPYRGSFADVKTHTMDLIYNSLRKTKYFSVDSEKCIHCGKCAGVCPGFDIAMAGKPEVPVWTVPECCLCMGCFEICPEKAIRYKGKQPDPRYMWDLYE